MFKALAIKFLLNAGYSVFKQFGKNTYYDVGANRLCSVKVVKENYLDE